MDKKRLLVWLFIPVLLLVCLTVTLLYFIKQSQIENSTVETSTTTSTAVNIDEKESVDSKILYVYYRNTEKRPEISDKEFSKTEIENQNLEYMSSYKCKSTDCFGLYDAYYREDAYPNRAFIYDTSDVVAFNYKERKVELSEKLVNYAIKEFTKVVADTQLRGLIYGPCGAYYSFKEQKIITADSACFTQVTKNCLYSHDDEKLLSFDLKECAPTFDSLDNYKGTEFYYLELSYAHNTKRLFYNKDVKKISDMAVEENSASGSKVFHINRTRLVINKGKYFEVYDSNATLVYKSNNYQVVRFLNSDTREELQFDGFIVVDNDNMVRMVNSKNDILATFTKVDDISKIAWAGSGYYSDWKTKVVLCVVDSNVTVDDILQYGSDEEKKLIANDSYDNWRGYKYVYNIATKSVTKEPGIVYY